MTDAQAAAHGIDGGNVAHSEEIPSYASGWTDDVGFGADLRHPMESVPNGDGDTDDIGSYRALGSFRPPCSCEPSVSLRAEPSWEPTQQVPPVSPPPRWAASVQSRPGVSMAAED